MRSMRRDRHDRPREGKIRGMNGRLAVWGLAGGILGTAVGFAAAAFVFLLADRWRLRFEADVLAWSVVMPAPLLGIALGVGLAYLTRRP